MTEPTDAELTECYKAANGEDVGKAQPLTTQRIFRAMRAAIAKWGTPPAVAGEPECTCSAKDMPFGTCCKVRSAFERWYDEQNDGRLQPFDVFKGGWIERHRLSSTPQPTQAQAGAVPLTDEQWQRIADLTDSILTRATKDEIERVIGIKGGQHGAE